MNIRYMAFIAGLLPSGMLAQSVIDSSSFYDPDFKVRRPGATTGLLNLTVTNTPFSNAMSSGNSSWTHSAGGLAQVRTNVTVPVIGTVLANVDAQLAAYTETTGNSLVFGRELSATATLAGIPVSGQDGELTSLLNQVTGASVIYEWETAATYSNLTIVPDQLYQVDFTVTSGAGLPVNLLGESTFGITTAGVTGASNESSQLLDLLGIVTLGAVSDTGNFTFQFKSSTALDHLDFNFAASSLVGVTALGGTANNQNVLTYSNFQVTQVPEPSSAMMLTAAIGLCILRRKRCA